MNSLVHTYFLSTVHNSTSGINLYNTALSVLLKEKLDGFTLGTGLIYALNLKECEASMNTEKSSG